MDEQGESPGDSLRVRLGARGEEAIGKLAQELLEKPWVNSAVAAALEARGKASQAQEVAMELLNLPSAAQIERLTRRVRSVSQRLESIEDGLSGLEGSMRLTPLAARLDAIEQRLGELTTAIAELRAHADGPTVVSRDQERLRVDGTGDASATAAAANPTPPAPSVGGDG